MPSSTEIPSQIFHSVMFFFPCICKLTAASTSLPLTLVQVPLSMLLVLPSFFVPCTLLPQLPVGSWCVVPPLQPPSRPSDLYQASLESLEDTIAARTHSSLASWQERQPVPLIHLVSLDDILQEISSEYNSQLHYIFLLLNIYTSLQRERSNIGSSKSLFLTILWLANQPVYLLHHF